jgi:hypothetical protein
LSPEELIHSTKRQHGSSKHDQPHSLFEPHTCLRLVSKEAIDILKPQDTIPL